ncbi:hypothetical protein Tsubulata_046795, partial [Turnera subulata]
VEDVVISVFKHHSENYHQLQTGIKRACHAFIEKTKEKSKNWALEVVEMEKLTDYTLEQTDGYQARISESVRGK